jgi:hypothetical protein
MALESPNLLSQFSRTLIKDTVDIIEFAESDQYCNKPLYPRQKTLLKIIFLQDLDDYDEMVLQEWIDSTENGGEVEIVPKIRERMQYLKDNGYKHFRVNQLVGGRRSSKGHLTGLCMAYKLYQLTQLDSVGKHYGIEKSKPVMFSIVGASLDEVKAHQFADAATWIEDCKPLQDQGLLNKSLAQTISVYTPYDLRRVSDLRSHGMKIDRDLATLKVQAFGNNSKTLRGGASIMFTFDEMAHLLAGESRMSDDALYESAIPSLNQFHKDAMIFANSSPYTKTGKFFELYELALKLDPPETGEPEFPEHFMIRYPSWELYKDKERSSYFINVEPPASDPKFDAQMAREERANPESFKVEYRANFAEVVSAFLRPEMVDRMFDPSFTKQTLDRILTPETGAVGFLRYKGHADPSSTTANFGLSVGHIEEVPNPETGVLEQHVVMDLIDAFYPADFEENTIDVLEVLPAIQQIINNFRPYEFTFDQYESDYPIRILGDQCRRSGIDTNIFEITASAKQNEKRARNFKTALNLGRVHAPHPETAGPLGVGRNSIELARYELKFLQEKNGKIDRQKIGPVQTKDIADCIMEVVDALIGDSLMSMTTNLSDLALQTGSRGGYGIGKTPAELADWYPRKKGFSTFMPERGMRRGNQRRRFT